ncbi:cytochrome P450 2J2 [Trichonephila clavipes]|nr:cytochrome P450 2J2 [Trichonephila clavipes]
MSTRTIRRHLLQSGLSARRPLLGLPLMQNQRRIPAIGAMKEGYRWQNEMKLSLRTSQASVCNTTMVGFESGDTVERGCLTAALCTTTRLLWCLFCERCACLERTTQIRGSDNEGPWFGKNENRKDVLDEINHFLEVLKNKNGQPIDVKEPLSPSMSNNICALIFGKRYEYDDPDRQLLDKNLDEGNEYLSQTSASLLFPWIRFIPFYNKFLHIEKSIQAFDKIRNLFKYVCLVQYYFHF